MNNLQYIVSKLSKPSAEAVQTFNHDSTILLKYLHIVTDVEKAYIQSIFNISSKAETENLMSQVRELPKHQSFYVDGKKEITLMRNLAFWELQKDAK